MSIEWFETGDGDREPACGECGHPLENSELRFGRCRNCGEELESDPQDDEMDD